MLLFLDIETIPGPIKPDVSEVKVPANYKDEAKIRAYQEEHLEEAWRRQALDSMSGSIICIGYALEDGPVTTFCVEDEAKVVSDFAALVGELQGRYSEPLNWCGWNIATFDLPWLWRKAVKYGLARLRNAIPRDNHYGMIVDLMRVWAADYQDRSSLSKVAAFLGIPHDGGNGSEIHDLWLSGELDAIAAHCRRDIETTRAIWERIYK